MATIWITELNEMALMTGGEKVQTPLLHTVAEQSFSFTTATSATAFNAATRCIRVITDDEAHLKIGGTATTSSLRIAADSAEYFGVTGGDVLSVIAAT